MESGIIKLMFILAVTLFLNACGSDVSEQIKGVKWKQGEYSLMRFHNNELQICKIRRGKWRSMGNYEINGNELVLKQGSNVTRGTIDVTGDGINRILILKHKDSGEQHFKIDRSDNCVGAIENNGTASKEWCESMKNKPQAEWTINESKAFMDSCKLSDLLGK